MKRLAIFLFGLIVSLSTVAAAATTAAVKPATKPATPSASAIVAKEKQLMGFMEVPKGHWAYEAFMRLSDAGLSEFDLQHRTKDGVLLTRYEFSLVMGRFFVAESVGPSFSHQEIVEVAKKRKVKSKPQTILCACGLTQQEYQEAVDIIAALRSEFQRELEILGFDYKPAYWDCPRIIEQDKSKPLNRFVKPKDEK